MRSWLSVLIADARSKKRDDIPIAPSLYSLSTKMDNSLLAVRDINHKYIVVVKGVKLSKDDQDVISRKIAERVGQMKPYVSSDCVEVIFQNIADESKIIEELYVVEVVVKSWTNDILFSTSKGEVYIKTEGGKKKLDAYGIQEELRGRLNGF